MTDQRLLEQVIRRVLDRLEQEELPDMAPQGPAVEALESAELVSGDAPVPVLEPRVLQSMLDTTPARIGIGRAGPRLRTSTLLRLRADHAAARDAVTAQVSEQLLERMGLFTASTCCKSLQEHLTRPDLGRQLDEEAVVLLKNRCARAPTVQVYVSDGLSSTAVEAGIPDCLPALDFGLKRHGLKTGTPFFLRYGRVPAMDMVSQLLGAQVTCVLIGERPGLATADSMSAYIAYRAEVGMAESRRTVISNIHKGGLPAVEAGAHIADVIQQILEHRASGVDLRL